MAGRSGRLTMGAPARSVVQRPDGPAGADGQRDSVDGGAGGGAPSMSVARRVLADVFGFEAFRPGQEAVIEALLAGRNVLSVMPTGSGKSLCFQVPALVGDGLTVVVSPLVALMRD